MSKLLIWLGGGDPEVLAQCRPGEARKYAGYGGAIFFTGILAAVAGTFAIHTWFRVPQAPAALAGAVWGLGIMNLDRLLFMALTRQSAWWRTALLAVPRVALAILVGRVVAEPVVLQLFRSEITQQAYADRDATDAAAQQTLQREYGSIRTLTTQRNALRARLNSNDPYSLLAQSPAYRALQQRAAAAQATANQEMNLAACEADGTCGTHRTGQGPVWTLKARNAQADQGVATALAAQLSAMRRQLLGSAASTIRSEHAQAAADLRTVQADLSTQISRYDAASKTLAGAADAPLGYLDRATALGHLLKANGVVRAKYDLFALFIIVLDSLPVLIKALVLFGEPTHYEQVEKELGQRRVTALENDRETYQRARQIEAEIAVDDAEIRRDLAREVSREIHTRVLEVQREVALQYVERWREAVTEHLPDWLSDHLSQAPDPRTNRGTGATRGTARANGRRTPAEGYHRQF